jgi:hypothetical protein
MSVDTSISKEPSDSFARIKGGEWGQSGYIYAYLMECDW